MQVLARKKNCIVEKHDERNTMRRERRDGRLAGHRYSGTNFYIIGFAIERRTATQTSMENKTKFLNLKKLLSFRALALSRVSKMVVYTYVYLYQVDCTNRHIVY